MTTESTGLKPILNKIGAAMATGTPNPPKPCIKEVRISVSIRIWRERSFIHCGTRSPISSMAPTSLARWYRVMAPQTIKRISIASRNAFACDQASSFQSAPKKDKAMNAATPQEAAAARLPLHLKASISRMTVRIGRKERSQLYQVSAM
jgi:hypothetical protein